MILLRSSGNFGGASKEAFQILTKSLWNVMEDCQELINEEEIER